MIERRFLLNRSRSGFTLIEILAVVLIVGILATILITQLSGAEEAANVQTTKQELVKLSGVIDSYENKYGQFPPSSFTTQQGVANDGTNVGVEALVVALWSNKYEAGGLIEPDRLKNTDGDSSARTLGDLGRGLLEFVDGWENPIAYIRKDDYATRGRLYGTFDPETGEQILSEPKALGNATTGRYYENFKFQLISAGPDGWFGTEDDITHFNR